MLTASSCFSSLDFDYERDDTGIPDADSCIRELPELCSGILLFDIFVANPDRYMQHMWCDKPTQPKRLLIIDHDFALLGGDQGGVKRLNWAEEELGLAFEDGHKNMHPFLRKVNDRSKFDVWLRRIHSIPEWFIERICREARQLAREIDKTEEKAMVKFLKNRKRELESWVIFQNRSEFSGIYDWSGPGLF